MPTYQYACTACEHRFDAVQSFSDASLTECPVCAGRLRKVFSSVGIVFKGSGFYRTDSRANGDKAAADPGKDSGKDAGKDAGSGGKEPAKTSDTKTADSTSAGAKTASPSGSSGSGSGSSSSTPAAAAS